MDWHYVPIEETELAGSLIVVGVPSGGTVGPVAAAFLVEHLGMRVLGGLQSDAMPPVGVVRKGRVTSALQVWGTDMACGLDGRCDRLLVLRSDVALEAESLVPLAGMVARWAREQGLALLVGLEGFPAGEGPAGAGPGAVLAAASVAGAEVMGRLRAKPVEEATLTGFTAALLLRANRERVPALGLFAPVEEGGEAGAAAALLEVVDPLVPNIKIRGSELAKQAEALGARLREERERQARAAKRLEERAERGYV